MEKQSKENSSTTKFLNSRQHAQNLGLHYCKGESNFNTTYARTSANYTCIHMHMPALVILVRACQCKVTMHHMI
jgi:protein involved in ribonucleotide reduction